MNTKNVLLNINKEGIGSVYVQYIDCNRKSKRIPTKVRLKEKHWNKEKGMIQSSGNKVQEKKSNDHIRSIHNSVAEIVSGYYRLNNVLPSVDFVNQKLNEIKESRNKGSLDFYQVYKKFLIVRKNDGLAEATYNNYTYFKNLMVSYESFKQRGNKGYRVTFENINYQFFLDFKDFCYTVRGMQPDSLSRKLTMLKVFLNFCSDIGINHTIDTSKFVVKNSRNKTVITLDANEILNLIKYRPPSKKLEKVKDLFLVGIECGLRFSDLKRLNQEHIVNNEIVIISKKTKKLLRIPLSKNIDQILRVKYKYSLPKISNAKFNDYLVELFKGIKSYHKKVLVTIFEEGREVERMVEKYKVITSHTMRRTFVNTCIQSGIPISNIMRYTGHKKVDVFQVYLDKEQKSKENFGKAFELAG